MDLEYFFDPEKEKRSQIDTIEFQPDQKKRERDLNR